MLAVQSGEGADVQPRVLQAVRAAEPQRPVPLHGPVGLQLRLALPQAAGPPGPAVVAQEHSARLRGGGGGEGPGEGEVEEGVRGHTGDGQRVAFYRRHVLCNTGSRSSVTALAIGALR